MNLVKKSKEKKGLKVENNKVDVKESKDSETNSVKYKSSTYSALVTSSELSTPSNASAVCQAANLDQPVFDLIFRNTQNITTSAKKLPEVHKTTHIRIGHHSPQ